MNVVEWLTLTTACGVCLRPTAPDEETVVCVDISPTHGSCVVCARCFFAAPPPRLAHVQMRVNCVIRIVSGMRAPRGSVR